ncbi:hypothetical protein BDC45DRAFT_540735 [Circinella umbellata]|nr:hypothetical protein BDC45DRAFT_540735 [Circinella umbellata]
MGLKFYDRSLNVVAHSKEYYKQQLLIFLDCITTVAVEDDSTTEIKTALFDIEFIRYFFPTYKTVSFSSISIDILLYGLCVMMTRIRMRVLNSQPEKLEIFVSMYCSRCDIQ